MTKNLVKLFFIALLVLDAARPAHALSEIACGGPTLDNGKDIPTVPTGGEAAYYGGPLVQFTVRTQFEHCPRDFTQYARIVTVDGWGTPYPYVHPRFPKITVLQNGRELGWFGAEYLIGPGGVSVVNTGNGFRWVPVGGGNRPQSFSVSYALEAEPGVPFDALAAFQMRIDNNSETWPASALLDVPGPKLMNQVRGHAKGLWHDPAEPGWGVMLEQHPGSAVFANWLTYDTSGKATWFVMPNGQPVSRDTVEGDVYFPSGPPMSAARYDASAFHPGSPVGKFRIQFDGGERATMEFDVNGQRGSKHLVPLVVRSDTGAVCDANSGVYWHPNMPGFALSLIGAAQPKSCGLHMILSIYGADGRPVWYFAGAAVQRVGLDSTGLRNDIELRGDAFQTSGAYFGGPAAARPFAVGAAVGDMAVAVQPASVYFRYRLNGFEDTLPLARFKF